METAQVSVSKPLSLIAEHSSFGRIELRLDRISAQHLAAQLRAHAGVPMVLAGLPDVVTAELVGVESGPPNELDAMARRIASTNPAFVRAAAILSCEEARDRQKLAHYIAESTSVPVEAARRMLAASPTESEGNLDAEARRIAGHARR